MTKLLEGIRVLELSIYAFVPSSAALLSDWGASVIKVEHPETGDPMRTLAAFGWKPGVGGVQCFWEVYNRGKRSVGIDIRSKQGLQLVMELVDRADIFLTNFLPETCTRLGIDAAAVRTRNPRIIYGRGTAYGPEGPSANKGGFDGLTYWGHTGGATAAMPKGWEFPIQLPGPGFGDIQAGAHLAHGVVAGLYRREKTGEGCVVDVSLFSAGIWAMQPSIATAYAIGRDNIVQNDRRAPVNPAANVYKTADSQFIALGMLESDRYWEDFCKAMGCPHLAADARFSTFDARATNTAACAAELDKVFGGLTYPEVKQRLERQEAPWQRIGNPIDMVTNEQALANKFVQVLDYGNGAKLPLASPPARIAGEIPTFSRAPTHAEHTDDVLQELGRSEEQILQLKLDNIIT